VYFAKDVLPVDPGVVCRFLLCMTAVSVTCGVQVAITAAWDTLNTVTLDTHDGLSEVAPCSEPRCVLTADNCITM
jgi:hypothetical protein